MLTYPAIDPVAVALGPVRIHWYGIMYLLGFMAAWMLGTYRAGKKGSLLTKEQVSDLIFYGAMGVVLGGRFGYVMFYNFDAFLRDPLWLFAIWKGGMSFHGGLLGVTLALFLFARKLKLPFFYIADFTAPLVPIGLGAGRIGNFIGGELWGRATDVPWGMVFPGGGPLARHPSQLYQFALEGLLLFIILWIYSSRPRPLMAVSGLFLICYGSFRVIVEFFRQPDAHLDFIALGWVTMGQILSLPMVLAGVAMMYLAYRNNNRARGN